MGKQTPILGVCLGHQAIGHVFGGTVGYAPSLMHGKTSLIEHDGMGLFEDVPQSFTATRYHSLVVDEASLPDELEITARTPDGVIMGLRHRKYPIEGIQFHPESILTVEGPRLIANWLKDLKKEKNG
jgi:anthranilate synthase component 2